jgi:PadR family transcriptional regulator AphA
MLEQEPSSGYDLLKHFRESLGYFWNAKHQQIYHQLKVLNQDGLINCENATQKGKPDKKVYEISHKGRTELQTWLAEPVSASKTNDALLVKLYGTAAGDEKSIFEELQRHIALHQHILEKLRGIEAAYHALPEKQQEAQRFPFITLRRGIIGEEAWLQWATEATQLFKK